MFCVYHFIHFSPADRSNLVVRAVVTVNNILNVTSFLCSVVIYKNVHVFPLCAGPLSRILITCAVLSVPFVFQMKNWKRRYFILDEKAVKYFKSDLVRASIYIDIKLSYVLV